MSDPRRSLPSRLLDRAVRRLDAALPAAVAPLARRSTWQARYDSVRNTLTGIGDDKVDAGRPDMYRLPLTYSELTSLWRYNGYCRRFVEVVPQDATRKGWRILDGDGAAADGVEDEHERLDLVATIAEADTWGRLYGGAWVLMVTDDDIPPEFASRPTDWLAQPLDLARIVRVRNLVVLDWSEVTPASFEADIRDKRYRMPSTYRINPTAGGTARGLTGGVVHASRLLYFAGAKLPPQLRYINNGIDDSVLQSVWDQARNKTTVDHALAAVGLELRISVLKMRDLADVQVNDEAEYFDFRMRELAKHKSILNTVLLAEGEEYAHHTGTVAGMGELDDRTRQSLQAVTAMPEQLWIGSAPGGLSTDGESHRNLWANVVSSYQLVKYSPQLRPLYRVLFAASAGPWAGVEPEGWRIEYRPLDEPTSKGTADTRLVTAQTDAVYIGAGVLDPDHVAKSRFGSNGWQDEILPIDESGFGGGLDVAAIQAELARLEAEGDPDAAMASTTEPVADGLMERRALAAEMTEHDVERCEHGRPNRCPQCGVERVRGLAVGADGAPEVDPETGGSVWTVAWRAIGDEPPSEPAATDADADADTDTDGPRQDAQLPRRRLAAIQAAIRRQVESETRAVRHRWHQLHGAPPAGRMDATEPTVSIWVGVPWPDNGKGDWDAARLEAATVAGVQLDELDIKGLPPHVTLLWVGKIPAADIAAAAADVEGVFDDLLENHRVIAMQGQGLGAFDPSPASDGDTPLIISLWSDALRNLNDAASKRLLTDEARAEQPWYHAHGTLGYLPGELPFGAWEKLCQSLSGHGSWTAETVTLSVGGVTTKTWQLAPLEG